MPPKPVVVSKSFRVAGGAAVRGVTIGAPSPKGLWNSSHDNEIVEFDRDLFARFIHEGTAVVWQKRIQCPNRSDLAPSQNHNMGCCVCDGRGWISVKEEAIKVQMTSFTQDEQRMAQGWWLPGTVSVTAMPEYRLSEHDRLICGNGAVRYDEIIYRTPDRDYDVPRFSVLSKTDLPDNEDSVLYLGWKARDNSLRVFTQDTHFRIDSGKILWLTTDRVDSCSYYTVAYYTRPQYIVVELPHVLRTRHYGASRGLTPKAYEYPVQVAAHLETQIREMYKDAPNSEPTDPLR